MSARRWLAPLLALVLLVSGCSGGSDTDTDTEFAPYVDVSATHTALADIASATGQKDFVLAFALAGTDGTATWGGSKSITDSTILQEVSALKAMGGSVTVATGGASGTYLENTATDAASLAAAYESLLDTVGTNSLDLDLEQDVPVGTVITALRQLQDDRGTEIMLTLPVQNASQGLSGSAMQVLHAAQAAGLDVTVNAMLMNFDSSGDWATAMTQALRSVTTQIRSVWTDLDDAGAHRMLGATLMIGQTDLGQITTTAAATTVLAAAGDLAFVSFWSVNRDNGTCAGEHTAQGSCSGVEQNAWDFTNLFRQSV